MSTTNNAKPSEAEEYAWRHAFAYADCHATTEDATAYANYYQQLIAALDDDMAHWPAHSDVFPGWERANSGPTDHTGECEWCGAAGPTERVESLVWSEAQAGNTCWVCATCAADHEASADPDAEAIRAFNREQDRLFRDGGEALVNPE